MENLNVAQSLVRGSDNINKMRSEIKMVITMVLGLVDSKTIEKYLNFDEQGATYFRALDCEWILSWELKGKQEDMCISGIGLSLLDNSRIDTSVFLWNVSDVSFFTKIIPCNLDKVQMVYEALPVFVNGMLKTFPYLTERLEPFFKASKVNI